MFDIERFVALVPTSEPLLRRLNELHRSAGEPARVAVLGKYNHGKSRLLNVLVGTDHFRVSDKRETATISEYEHNGVVWIDTPGLDADPVKADDRKTHKVAFEIADFLFLVHAVTEGELDRSEINKFMELGRQDMNYRQKMVLVLTKIDQAPEVEVAAVEKKCRAQLQDNVDLRELYVMPVSVVRYGNPQLRSLSGMADVFATVEKRKTETAGLRRREWFRLTGNVLARLSDKREATRSELMVARNRLRRARQELRSDVETFCAEIWGGLACLSSFLR